MIWKTSFFRNRRSAAAVVCLLGLALVAWRFPGEVSAGATPGRAMLLLAAPRMPDPRFARAVVLLLEHDRRGTYGVIVNRPTGVSLARGLPGLEAAGRPDVLFYGGPVAPDSGLTLIRAGRAPAGTRHLVADIYFTTRQDVLQRLLDNGQAPDRLRVLVGHAGWGPGQLAGELARGDWRLLPAEAGAVFDPRPERTWSRLIRRAAPGGIQVRRPGAAPGPDRPVSRPAGENSGPASGQPRALAASS